MVLSITLFINSRVLKDIRRLNINGVNWIGPFMRKGQHVSYIILILRKN